MQKVTIDVETLKHLHILLSNEKSIIFQYANNQILKIFNQKYQNFSKSLGVDLEQKILNSTHIDSFTNLVYPNESIYDNSTNFLGYLMDKIEGKSYKEIKHERNVQNHHPTLLDYAKLYQQFAIALDRATKNNIVIPDFATCSNIIIPNQENSEIKIIDYDGIQIKQYGALFVSSNIKSKLIYSEKYFRDYRFTTELNRLSLLYLYFVDVLKIHLINYDYHSINNILKYIGLDDKDIKESIYSIYSKTEANPDFSNIFYRLEELYNLENKDQYNNEPVKLLKKYQ